MNVVLGDWVVTIFTQDPTIFVAFVAEVFFCCVFVCWPVTRWFEFKDRVVVLVRFAAVVALCDGDFTCAHVFSVFRPSGRGRRWGYLFFFVFIFSLLLLLSAGLFFIFPELNVWKGSVFSTEQEFFVDEF